MPVSAVGSALTSLCATTKSFLALIAMLSFIAAPLPLIIGAALFFFKKEDKNLRLAGTLLLAIGVMAGLLALLSVVIYLLTPALVGALIGGGASVVC